MSTETWLPIHHGDILKETIHLSHEQSWAYMRLLFFFWDNGAIKNDKKTLENIAGISSKKLQEILPLFEEKNGYLYHERMEKEKEKARRNQEKARLRTQAASDARWKKNQDDSSVTLSVTDSVSISATDTPSPSPSPFFQNKEDNSLRSLSKKKEFSSDGCENSEAEENPSQPEPDHPAPLPSAKSIPVEQLYVALDQRKAKPPPQPKQPRKKPLTPMPEGFEPNADHIDRFRKIGIVQAEKINREFEKFADHHKKRGSQFADWDAALRTWIGNIEEFQAASDKRGSGWINQNCRDQSPSELAAAAAELLKRKASGGLQPDWLGTTIDI